MHVEILRGVLYRGESLVPGRVYDVEARFGEWMISRGKAIPYKEPEPVLLTPPAVFAEKKRLRNR